MKKISSSRSLHTSQVSSLRSSLKLLKAITKKTHNEEIAPIALVIWEKHLQPENPLWKNIVTKPFRVDDKAHVMAMLDPRLPGLGLVGFFGCTDINSGSQVLLKACDWLKEQGIDNVYGPINGTITRDYRLNLADDFRVPGEPVNPLFYIDAFRKAGFGVFNQYVCGIAKHYKLFNKLFIRIPPKDYSHLSVRAFNIKSQIDDLKIYHELMNLIFPSQSIYCPVITWEERYYNVADKDPIFDPSYTYFLEDGGQPVGMVVAFPYKGKLILGVLGILPEYRGHHISGLLIRKVHEQASRDHLEAAVYAMIRVGNQVYKMKHPGVKVYRRYVTMRKQI
jgi:GNAT superfamily N-acetyltransferase